MKHALRLSDHEAAVQKFFSAMDQEEADARDVRKPQRVANRYFELAKDNAMSIGVGWPLKLFVATRESYALLPRQRRYTVPNPWAGEPGEPPLRSCVTRFLADG